MSDDLVKRGYADGKYVCSCRKCKGTFMGDKRAWCCKGCAVSADRIEELEERLKAATDDAKEAEAYAAELEKRNASLETLIKDFFILLDKTEETNEGRVFRPNRISSCRVQDGQMLDNLLRLMKATVEGRW